MARLALFDHDGKCLAVYSGAGDLSVLDHAYSAEVEDDITPNTVEFDKATGTHRRKERDFGPRPPRAKPTAAEEIAELRAEIEELKRRLP